jgi:glycosyltransferase involved in cell wall biosynthesis
MAAVESRPDIVCFGEDWYSATVGITKQVMKVLKDAGHRVFWFNPIPYRMPSLSSKGFKQRLIYKLRSHLRVIARSDHHQVTVCPFYIPLVTNPFVQRLNSVLLNFQLLLVRLLFRVVDPIYWGTGYTVNHVMGQLSRGRFIYNFCDKYSSHRGLADDLKVRLEQNDAEIVQTADVVLCSSEKIFEYVCTKANGSTRDRVVYFPHGVDFDHFHQAAQGSLAVPEDIRGIAHPIVGYFGSLGSGFDREVIEYCARARPGWSFLLIGGVGADNEDLGKQPNVHLLGPKPYTLIPSYGQCFDVCLMTWKPDEWAEYCFPIKTLEYLAMGKPVVSMRIEEISRHYSDVIAVAEGPEDFLHKIEQELKTDSVAKRNKRVEKVRGMGWDNKMRQIEYLAERL